MDAKIQKQLDALKDRAAQGVKLTYADIAEAFAELNLDNDTYDKIYQELGSVIDVSNEEAEEEVEEAEKIEEELQNIDCEDLVKMYFQEASSHPLLTHEEEIELAKKIQDGRNAKEENEKMEESGKIEHDRYHSNTIRIREGKKAEDELTAANLRLVISVAKHYTHGKFLTFLDIVQEGNIGLIKAVQRYDYTLGYKFSTYAVWWIKQAITRASADTGRMIRIPVHLNEQLNKILKAKRSLTQKLAREPSVQEIAEETQMSLDRVNYVLNLSAEPVSLDMPVGEEEDSTFGEMVQDESSIDPQETVINTMCSEKIFEAMEVLTPRERDVIILRFGLLDGRRRTLEEVGRKYHLTRERIRQLESKSIRKLRHPKRREMLKAFYTT